MNQNTPSFKIRKTELNDIHLLVKYRLQYLNELQNKTADDEGSHLKNELEKYFKKALKEGRFFAFQAEDNNEVVSFGAMIIKEIPGDFNKPTYFEGDILNMYTVPKARKKGISTAILEKLIEEAKSRGISKVALHTSRDGENIYRNFGFSEPEYPYLEMVLNTENFTH